MTLSLFAPLLVAAVVALSVLVLGRIVAKAKADRALAVSEQWVPSAVSVAPDHPLNQVERRRRTTLTELLASVELDPADSAAITMRMIR